MVDYDKCRHECADFVCEKGIDECKFRKFCEPFNLPISKKEEEECK